ncbi:MAG TPA: DUF6166 domain-containing protein [Bacillus sp. (in: firmicutes)]|nr:DUF6166 domain-containing protein [Bacillus sp. (in: firmicutes)]
MNIILSRGDNGGFNTNIPWEVKKYDILGFEWGVVGEAAAELALNILALFCDEFTRKRLHGKFMCDVIAEVPYSGRIITSDEIETWLAANTNLEDKREKRAFIVAVFTEETKENDIRHVEAFNDIEAIVRACSYNYKEEEIKELLTTYRDYDSITDYYEERGLYFSAPISLDSEELINTPF